MDYIGCLDFCIKNSVWFLRPYQLDAIRSIQQSVKEIISGIDQYLLYYKDASTLPVPLERPTNKSSKGSRSLEYNIAFHNNNIFKGMYQ